MRKNYFIFILLCPLILISQTNPLDLFSELDKSEMTTDILFNHALSFSKIATPEHDMFSTNNFFQGYNELAAADKNYRFKDFKELKDAAAKSRLTGIIPIGLVYSEFEVINNVAFENGDVFMANGKLRKSAVSENPIFEIKQKLFAAPFRDRLKHRSLNFVLDGEFFVNTTQDRITDIRIDFDDGNGLRKVEIGQVISVNYSSSGTKELVFKIILESDDIFSSKSSIEIKSDPVINGSREAQISFVSSYTPDLSAYGESVSYPGEGEYEIFLDTDNGVLDKPIIAVDGFDPGDGRTIIDIYNSLSYIGTGGSQNFADDLRSQGFDIVILNFPVYTRAADMAVIDGGTDFIERNALLLVELINIINTSKTGSEQNVIIGPSMGGLISRYGLSYMENQSLSHDTRLFLSFDSPHRGANVPIGLQHMINYLAFGLGANNIVELQDFINGFAKSTAARQMLVDHLESHLLGGSLVDFDPALVLPAQHPWKTIFDTNVNGLTANGFPQTTRNVAIINGSGIGNPYPDKLGGDVTPGFNLLDDSFTIDAGTSTVANLEINYTPATASGSQLVSSIAITAFGFPILSASANSQAFSYSDGIDAASGGLYEMSLIGGTGTGVTNDFINALNGEFFNFIPSISSIALEITANGEIDWYHDINIGSGSPPMAPADVIDSTPFINWYMPDNNEEHIDLTDQGVAFALSEIIPETLSEGNLDPHTIRLLKNPIDDYISLSSSILIEKSKLSLYDLSGRQVILKDLGSWQSRKDIKIDLSSGIYIMELSANNGKWLTKLVVR
ncbi:MAG: T9SS type A sorting domain-containing protein [Bacteroidia bacterium]|nr:T9SS type A sorting domain-containing protein [Bacteroidia bacterium]MBT8269410.1 T9SS type A sorting domain-containing protein [Bacteroidia bacterium]NNF82175.1 T9SS type A sorting domain-containing protein [Flavobacteriaceae bacterium]NNK69385.1 T9SS type A sorting domain-containing protein [Flavobacteriaceae bacterium]NNL80313.1 T9SS type A sorting domain-containing protein [Flavobacteriaceae bacterium]